MRIRLRDVAERTGVSEATVSRVMNGRPGVNQHTRALVLRALAELGYEPPAPRHQPPRAGLVGLLVPELDNPVFPAYAQTIETLLATAGYTAVLCCATREGVQEADYIDMLLDRGVAGIVVVSGVHADSEADHSLYDRILERGVPLVLVNGYSPSIRAPFVSCDDRHAVQVAVHHLVSLGHRRIGLLAGPRRYVPVVRKLDAFEAAMASVGQAFEPELFAEAVFTVEGGHAGARRLLDAGATAIIAASDLMALGAIRAAREGGACVPGEVSIVGFDDTPLMAYTDPPLTTVRQPVRAIADHATRVLLETIAGRPADEQEYLVRPELVVRGSTGPASLGLPD